MNVDSLLFVHGWATDSWVWEPFASAFKGLAPLNVNLPGHGGQGKWDTPTIHPAVQEITRQIESRTNILGIGWSLGAQALIASALESRQKFTGLILVGATPSFVTKEDFPWGQSRALTKRMIMDMKKDPGGTLKRFYPLNFIGSEKSVRVREFMERYRYPGPISCDGPIPGCFPSFKYGEITRALEALYSEDLREMLDALDLPVLIVHGRMDGIVPIGAGQYLASTIDGARLEVYEKTGHAPFITEPEKFKDTIKRFMDGL